MLMLTRLTVRVHVLSLVNPRNMCCPYMYACILAANWPPTLEVSLSLFVSALPYRRACSSKFAFALHMHPDRLNARKANSERKGKGSGGGKGGCIGLKRVSVPTRVFQVVRVDNGTSAVACARTT